MTPQEPGGHAGGTRGAAKVALNPISWYLTAEGWHPELAPPLPEVYRQVRAAGFAAVHADPPPTMALDEYRALLSDCDLAPAPGYFSAPFSEGDRLPESLERAKHAAAQHAALGLERIFIAEQFPDPPRLAAPAQGVGHDPARLGAVVDNLRQVARAMVAEGVTPCLHQHVGTLIETAAEADRVLAEIEADLLLVGADTGHLSWAGADPAEFVRRHAGRVGAVHVKDVRLEVASSARMAGEDYFATSARHLWTEPGRGDVDLDAVVEALAGFDGWFVVEVDVADQPTPAESAAVSWRWCEAHLGRRPSVADRS